MLEQNGVRVAAISYDAQAALQTFAQQQDIGYPLLSDHDSSVIRKFGIFNANIAPGLRAHGVPHPVTYLLSPDGTVVHKYFVPNYQHRVTGAAVVLEHFGAPAESAAAVKVNSGPLAVSIGLSNASAFAGQEIGFFAKFALEPGWHIYGQPLPATYTPTSITFDDPNVTSQSFELPGAELLTIPALNETLPIYSGAFQGQGRLLLKFPLEAGPITLSGKLHFQQCSDTVCEAPQTVAFQLPLTIEIFLIARPK